MHSTLIHTRLSQYLTVWICYYTRHLLDIDNFNRCYSLTLFPSWSQHRFILCSVRIRVLKEHAASIYKVYVQH
jgi:hypothetical protein